MLSPEDSKVQLRTYTGDHVQVLGTTEVEVRYENQSATLPLLIVAGEGPTLLGRNWLCQIRLNWPTIFQIKAAKSSSSKLQELLNNYGELFNEGMGTFTGPKAKIYPNKDPKPRYFKPRPVPYSVKTLVEDELERLQREKIIEPVEFSDWAAPIVPVLKDDNTVRIYGDYKLTINQESKLDNYPIPKAEDLFANLGKGEKFTKLDLSQAYQQLPLDEDSKQYTTINTHKGLFRYNRLPYGISSSPGIFQRTMDNLLQNIPQVNVRVDDILITGVDDDAHLANLEDVLKRLTMLE